VTAEPGARSGPGPLIRALGHTTGVRLPPRVVSEELFEEDLVLIMSPDHALAGRAEVPLADLEDETFVCYKEGSGIRASLVRACETQGFEPRVSFECGTLRALAAAGLGVAVVPRSMAECPGPPVAVADLRPNLTRAVAVFRMERRYLGPPAEAFLRFVKERISEHASPR
jgi:DNA-binding transcriptional LysR family regulator